MWLVLVFVVKLVTIFLSLFVFFLTWEPFCLFYLGNGLEVGVVSVAMYVRRNN